MRLVFGVLWFSVVLGGGFWACWHLGAGVAGSMAVYGCRGGWFVGCSFVGLSLGFLGVLECCGVDII